MLATYLRWKGADAIHTTHFPEGHLLQDADIAKIALREQRIIVTKDSDFPDALFSQRGTAPAGLSALRQHAQSGVDRFFGNSLGVAGRIVSPRCRYAGRESAATN